MSAHLETEAVEAGPADPLDDIAKFIGEDDEQEETPDEEGELEDEGDEPEAEAEDEPEDEPELPAITPPVSLSKEQKAAFSQLPPELQKVWADTEAQRNRDVQIKTTEAAEAKRNAQAEAQSALASIQRQYASELEIYAQAFQPIDPDPNLIAQDPYEYARQVAIRDQQISQYNDLMGRVQAARQQADQTDSQGYQQHLQAEMQKVVQQWPEWGDPAKRTELAQSMTAIASELGFSADEIVDSRHMLALRTFAEAKDKAAKWDAFQARKMANVRAAKELPKVARPGNSPSRNPSKAQRADAAWQRAKSSKAGTDYADFLEASGVNLD